MALEELEHVLTADGDPLCNIGAMLGAAAEVLKTAKLERIDRKMLTGKVMGVLAEIHGADIVIGGWGKIAEDDWGFTSATQKPEDEHHVPHLLKAAFVRESKRLAQGPVQ